MGKALTILVAEDDPNDALLLQLAFERAGVGASIHFVCDGKEAVDYLAGVAPFKNRAKHPLPNLLLLDLNMARLNGFDVLEWLRRQTTMKWIFVVVLSNGTWHESDLDRAEALGASLCITKPLDFGRLVTVAKRLEEEYWLQLDSMASAHLSSRPQPSSLWRV